MASFQVSPGVNVKEIDLSTIVPGVSTTEAALAGVSRWGPLNERILLDSEDYMRERIGDPTNLNAETWFTGASFLSYGNKLYFVRVGNTATGDANAVLCAVANVGTVNVALQTVKNEDDYESNKDGTFSANAYYVARCPGELGNSLRIAVCDSADQFYSVSNLSVTNYGSTFTMAVGSNTGRVFVAFTSPGDNTGANAHADALIDYFTVGDLVEIGNTSIGFQYVKVSAVAGSPTSNSTGSYFDVSFESQNRLAYDYSSGNLTRYWEFYNVVDVAPGQSSWQTLKGNTSANDEVHAVVVDAGGKFTGVPGTILETYRNMSRATDAMTDDGATNYYKNVINSRSKYIWWANDRPGAASNTAVNLASSSNTASLNIRLAGGQDGYSENTVPVGLLSLGYDKFASGEEIDVSIILQGKARGGTDGGQLANYIIDNICERRKDCVVFISPAKEDVVNNYGDEATDIVAFRNTLRSTSYGFMDSGYKYMYDKYNDLYRWIPLNGDIGGLAVRTDMTNDPWWSFAGFNRGNIKNLVKLAYSPRQADRDILQKAGVNPVVSFPGNGTILYGDKTLLAKPSAFDRINVRRLFIVLEKAISTAAKFTLFEFNDDFTRAQFRNMVNPYLRDVQGRRGIYEFSVICDETNNTPEVIDSNTFKGAILIKPARSINFIELDFVAVRTGVQFSEIIGRFG